MSRPTMSPGYNPVRRNTPRFSARTPSSSTTASFFLSSRRRHARCSGDWSSDVCSSDLVRERTGQSQQRLTELRGRLEEQARQPVPALDTSRGGAAVPVGPSGNPAGPGAEQMYDLAYQQYRASRYGTARQAFREFLRMFPTPQRAPDALYFIGESVAGGNPDSAATVDQQVVKTYPASPRAPSALYKLGFLA